MRRVLSLLIIMSLAFSLVVVANVTECTTIITIDENTVIKQADRGLLGYNDDATWQSGGW